MHLQPVATNFVSESTSQDATRDISPDIEATLSRLSRMTETPLSTVPNNYLTYLTIN
jgi:hypothetical protein